MERTDPELPIDSTELREPMLKSEVAVASRECTHPLYPGLPGFSGLHRAGL
jgi:hypothetical protein